MMKMSEAIAKGEDFLGKYKTKKTKVLIIDVEMSENDIIDRSQTIPEGEFEGLDIYYCDTFNIEDVSDYKWLTDSIKENEYGLIVFDTLSGIHNLEENSNSEMNKINKKLLELTNEHKVTILFLHHHKKLQKGEKMNQGSSRGASAIIDKSASQILIDSKDITIITHDKKPLKGLKMTLEQHKCRQLGKLERFAVEVYYNPETKKTSFKWAGIEEKKDSAMEKAKVMILKLMDQGEEYIIADFKDSVEGVSEKIIREAIRELVEVDQAITFRMPGDNEKQHNFRPIRANSKIYSLKTE